MPRKKKQKINNLIVISDLHCGCQFGLCEPSIYIDGGGTYTFSAIQADIFQCWEKFWADWVPQVTKGEPFAVVCNGDALDGIHHKATTQISHNRADQFKIAHGLLKPIVELCEGRYYHIRGTEAHVGPSGEAEEQLAQKLGAKPDKEGRFSRYELWLEVGTGLVHLSHHIGTSGSLAYETSAVQKEIEQAYVEAARWSDRPPDVVVRSHRHRNIETRFRTSNGWATACTTAAWQAKTPYVYKIAGGRQTLPQIGGSLVRFGGEDLFTRHQVWSLARSETEVCYE